MRRFHASAAYTPDWPASFWAESFPDLPRADLPRAAPARGAIAAEVAVIGAGYAGLNAALVMARDHGMSVVVLEAAQPGWGASGRNGGFCCLGGAKLSDTAIATRHGIDAARHWRRFEEQAIDHVAALLERYRIEARQGPAGEALLAHSPRALRDLKAGAEAALRLHGSAPEILPAAALAERGLAGPGFHGAALSPQGFPLNPMVYVQGLAAAARRAGVTIYGQSPVSGLTRTANGWSLSTPEARITARRVLIATNGYSAEDLPSWLGGRLLPVFSQVMVTRPLSPSERAAQGFTSPLMSYDSRALLHYFRHLPDGRFLFGMRGGLRAGAHAERQMQAEIRRHFHALFPAWEGIGITHDWSGLACLTSSLMPYAGRLPDHPGLYAAFGWHGNGVAAASLAGAEIGRQIAGYGPGRSGETGTLPELLRRPPPRITLPFARRAGLAAAYLRYRISDGPLPRSRR